MPWPWVKLTARASISKLRTGVTVAAVAGGLLAATHLAVSSRAKANDPAPLIWLGDTRLSQRPTTAEVDTWLEQYLAADVTLRVQTATGEREWVKSRAALSPRVDRAHLDSLLTQAFDENSPMRIANAKRVTAPGQAPAPIKLPIPVEIDLPALAPLLIEMEAFGTRAAAEARFDLESGTVRGGTPGARFNDVFTAERILQGLQTSASVVDASLSAIAPTRGASEIATVQAPDLLTTFETHYNPSKEAQDRAFNLKVAASKIDGYVLMPGEEFDFNKVVGERSEANGFRVATVISAGELVDGVGGGTCQIAGTLHAAVFFAGLPITERSPHTRPSYYIKLGLDAVVAYGSLNLKFTNNRPTPIVIGYKVERGTARVELRGVGTSNAVTFLRKLQTIVSFDVREESNANIPAGTRVLTQRGVPGFVVDRTRIFYNPDGTQRREGSVDRYPATTEIWQVGTGGANTLTNTLPKADAHPEYTADRVLVARLDPNTREISEERSGGASTMPGWTEAYRRPATP